MLPPKFEDHLSKYPRRMNDPHKIVERRETILNLLRAAADGLEQTHEEEKSDRVKKILIELYDEGWKHR